MTRTNDQTHQAGRHLAVAHALLRGLPAKVGPQANAWIEVNGQTAAVLVAGQGAWQIANVEKFRELSVERYVLVNVTSASPEFMICPGDELRAEVGQRHEAFLEKHGGVRPRNAQSLHAAIARADVEKWKDNWQLFEQPTGAEGTA